MGILRFLFALSVLLFHSFPVFGSTIIATRLAVPSFFILSGFLITYVLQTKYIGKNKSYWLFLTNRLFRIYPLYLVIFFLMLFLSLLKFYFHIGGTENAVISITKNGLWSTIVYMIQNITIVLGPDFWVSAFKNPDYLIGPQVWAIQVEIAFYLVAPFFLRMRPKAFLLISALLLIFLYLLVFPYNLVNSKSLLRLFLNHFVFFILGSFGYYLLSRYKKIVNNRTFVLYLFIFFAVIYSFFFPKTAPWYYDGVYYIFLSLSIPSIFISFAKNKLDFFLGALSYPVFISHIFFRKLLVYVPILREDKTIFSISLVVVTCMGSYFLMKYIEEPIYRLRQKRFKKSK